MPENGKHYRNAKRRTNPPVVHMELPNLENNLRTLRVRVVQYKHDQIGISPPMLDIRQFYIDVENQDGTKYTGFGPGVSLTKGDLEQLFEMIPKAIEKIDELMER